METPQTTTIFSLTATLSDERLDMLESLEVEYRDEEFMNERRRILEDAQNLKQYATYHLHPEVPVESGICARCYFNRASAPQQESMDNAEERHRILVECDALRHYAELSLHPEHHHAPRAITFEPELTKGEVLERELILNDAKLLKQYASFYLHPELPVETSDPAACARCYFDRPTAPENESVDDMEEHTHILEEVELLKTFANFYLHPESPVKTNDFAACERCFFDRPSAPERTSLEEAEEIHQILMEASKLEELAQVVLHHHVLQRDYFHCNFAMDEDSVHVEDENPVREEVKHVQAVDVGKHERDFDIAQSPPSIFGFH